MMASSCFAPFSGRGVICQRRSWCLRRLVGRGAPVRRARSLRARSAVEGACL
jgi:hypothetical protein